MGSLFGGGKSPKVPELPPAPPPPPKKTDQAVTQAELEQRRRAALQSNRTALTAGGQSGLNSTANTTKKTALGA